MNRKRSDRLIEIATRLKSEYQTGRSFHVSFILHGPKVLATGINSYLDSHPSTKLPKYTHRKSNTNNYHAGLHSEVAAAKMLNFACDGLVLFNIRINNDGVPAYSAPCGNCWDYVVLGLGFKKVYFTTEKGIECIKI
jgi:hypothetical protein